MKPEIILINRIIQGKITSSDVLSKEKRKIAKQFKTDLFTNIHLLKTYHSLVKNKTIEKSLMVERMLITRPIRSLSGIVNISVLTKPFPCPGQCIFCPTEKGFPKSYISGEPAADRAKLLDFNPYDQVTTRLQALKDQGHPTDKIELRIVGGTWSTYSKQYQTLFIKKCFQACNEFDSKKTKPQTLEQVQKKNQTAKNRVIGMSIETRPDFITPKEILRLRKLGVTLVELGVQTVFDEIHKLNKTNTSKEKVIKATKLLKDSGFKILYQVMPNLLGSDLKKDLESFKIIFQDNDFKPDWLKIYPCLVCPKTELLKLFKQGKYKPYSQKQLLQLLIEIKKLAPYWVRIARIFRDVPSQSIIGGTKSSNIRENIKKEFGKCICIRCREVKSEFSPKDKPILFEQRYQASNGTEIFLSFENKNRTKLFSMLRLRIPDKPFIPVLKNSGIIREVHTFGSQLQVKEKGSFSPQHKGLGKKLMKKAEEITKKEFKLNKVTVISGIGVRGYYKKLGYQLKNTYMVKNL